MKLTELIKQLQYYKTKFGDEAEVVFSANIECNNPDVDTADLSKKEILDTIVEHADYLDIAAYSVRSNRKHEVELQATWRVLHEIDEDGCDAGGHFIPNN
jgi:hypothetical protein